MGGQLGWEILRGMFGICGLVMEEDYRRRKQGTALFHYHALCDVFPVFA